MQLIEIIKEAEQEGNKLIPELEKIINNYDFSKQPSCQSWLRNDLYVRNLGGLCKILNTKRVAELGTCYGDSSIGLSLGTSKVDSYDINITNYVNLQIAKDRNITLIKLKDEKDFLNIGYSFYDFVYCDIGNHTGKEEQFFHDKLIELGYKGYVAYDDINWEGMKLFWNSIKQDKLAVEWHSDSGFGIVYY